MKYFAITKNKNNLQRIHYVVTVSVRGISI